MDLIEFGHILNIPSLAFQEDEAFLGQYLREHINNQKQHSFTMPMPDPRPITPLPSDASTMNCDVSVRSAPTPPTPVPAASSNCDASTSTDRTYAPQSTAKGSRKPRRPRLPGQNVMRLAPYPGPLPPPSTPSACVCPSKTAKPRRHWEYHCPSNPNRKELRCPEGDRKLSSPSNFQRHMQSCHSQSPEE